jgi:hypothetical protein
MKKDFFAIVLVVATMFSWKAEKLLNGCINTFLGAAPLTDPADIGFVRPCRVWAGLAFS